ATRGPAPGDRAARPSWWSAAVGPRRGAVLPLVAGLLGGLLGRRHLSPGRRAAAVARRPPGTLSGTRGCSSMAEHQLPKLTVGVRFPSPAPREVARTRRRLACRMRRDLAPARSWAPPARMTSAISGLSGHEQPRVRRTHATLGRAS